MPLPLPIALLFVTLLKRLAIAHQLHRTLIYIKSFHALPIYEIRHPLAGMSGMLRPLLSSQFIQKVHILITVGGKQIPKVNSSWSKAYSKRIASHPLIVIATLPLIQLQRHQQVHQMVSSSLTPPLIWTSLPYFATAFIQNTSIFIKCNSCWNKKKLSICFEDNKRIDSLL